MAKIKVSGELEVATAEGKLADAAQVFDSTLQKNQQNINKEFKKTLAKKIETVDSELLENSVNPVQNKVIYQAFTNTERVIGTIVRSLEAKIAKKKRIYMKFVQNTPAYFEGSWLSASPGETVCMAIQSSPSATSLTVTVVPLSANKATPTVTVAKVGTNSLSGTMVLWKVSITIPEDVEDNDIYLYKYHTSTT
jgi:hypothetical protein|nr:MAG TPA: hypothetical protein [Bacteriophage sp.]